ncbi:MAG: hypothetical protein MPJ50_03330 [Pirellulales bacterium]|nr:hypothetical protein [Pirellulales bacterium]
MAENKEEPETTEAPAKTGLKQRIAQFGKSLVDRCLRPRVMLSLAVSSFVIHSALYWYYSTLPTDHSREVALGEFHYVAYTSDGSIAEAALVSSADFELHVILIPTVEERARKLITLRERKLRQEIEELIRQSRDSEFADPLLVELKRRLLGQINHTLGIKAIEEVLITELQLSQREAESPSPNESEAITAAVTVRNN